MDIRDFKEVVEYPGSEAFGKIIELQKELLDKYIGIESLPPYPVDINTRTSQNLVKDFSARIVEELGEGFESYLTMMEMFHQGMGEDEMIPFLQNFNEEISDAIHFWMELMIYSGYEMGHILKWAEIYISSTHVKYGDPLQTWLDIGRAIVQTEVANKKIPCRWVIKDHMLTDEFLRGGRQLGSSRMDIMKQYLWDITFHLQIARNTLKNKPWKQTEMMTDTSQYEDSMRKTCLALFKFFAFTGFTKESLYVIYYKKNRVNLFRIKSKY